MKIVATVDFSSASETILRVAKTYAKKMDAEVFLVHAESPAASGSQDDAYDARPEAIRLKKDALALARVGVKVTPVFLQGPTCEMIIGEALRIKADLIIAGAHGHGGTSCKLSIGSISQCILLKSKIPVMIIPG